MSVSTAKADRGELRRQIRLQRRAMTGAEQESCAQRLARHAGKDPLVFNSQHIAAYLAADGEMDPWPLMERLWSLGKTLYLPILVPFSEQRLWFSAYTPGERLIANRFGILEPERSHYRRISPVALDLVLTPLVAFDPAGHRLGMGGGYYDRSFAFLKTRRHWRKPRLLGLAYEFQRLHRIDAAAWDVPLDAVATEDTVYHCQGT
jgi:5-formyltetrahydrofolate cyclo-ligase